MSTGIGSKPLCIERRGEPVRAGGHEHVTAVAHGVAAEHRRVLLVDEDRVRIPALEHGAAVFGEGAGEVDDLLVVQREQGGVEVVEARVDQLECHDLAPEDALHLAMRVDVGTEPGAAEDDVAGEHEVALTFVAVLRASHAEPAGAEPALVRPLLADPLGMPETGEQRDTVDDERAVGREDHVRQAPLGCDRLDEVPGMLVGGAELLPLRHGTIRVRRQLGVHPGIDRVDHGEVCGRAHEKTPRLGGNGRPLHGETLRPHEQRDNVRTLLLRSDSLLRNGS